MERFRFFNPQKAGFYLRPFKNMESLLDKVNRIEQEMKERLQQVEKSGKEQLADLTAAENDVVDEVRQRAEKQGQQIIQEQVRRAQTETNAMKQDREQSVAALRDTAEKNERRAADKVVELFASEFRV